MIVEPFPTAKKQMIKDNFKKELSQIHCTLYSPLCEQVKNKESFFHSRNSILFDVIRMLDYFPSLSFGEIEWQNVQFKHNYQYSTKLKYIPLNDASKCLQIEIYQFENITNDYSNDEILENNYHNNSVTVPGSKFKVRCIYIDRKINQEIYFDPFDFSYQSYIINSKMGLLLLHSYNGNAAYIDLNLFQWYWYGDKHREEDLPCVWNRTEDETKIEYCKYGYRHRIGAPALIVTRQNKNEIKIDETFYCLNQKSMVPYFEKYWNENIIQYHPKLQRRVYVCFNPGLRKYFTFVMNDLLELCLITKLPDDIIPLIAHHLYPECSIKLLKQFVHFICQSIDCVKRKQRKELYDNIPIFSAQKINSQFFVSAMYVQDIKHNLYIDICDFYAQPERHNTQTLNSILCKIRYNRNIFSE